jgi:hypothetical protein
MDRRPAGSRSSSSSSADSDSSSNGAAPPLQPVLGGRGLELTRPETESSSSSEEEEEGEEKECPSAKLPRVDGGREMVWSYNTDSEREQLLSEEERGGGGGTGNGGRKRKRSASPSTIPPSKYSRISWRMMESMGYKPGQALGRSGVGITEPISESAQLGRRGLGFTAGGLEREDVKWEEEEVNIHQKVEWLDCSNEPLPEGNELHSWMVEGERKDSIAGETHFTDPGILDRILKNKVTFDYLSPCNDVVITSSEYV